MFIYNVTTNIDDSVHQQWLQWMQETHIPDMIATGKFTEAKIVKVLVEEEMGGQTYSVQYTTDSKATLQDFYLNDSDRLKREVLVKFADKIVSFETELQIVSEH
ncbi:protein of unknown function [Pustulibacterium marinum]|uniref:DUF4286 domain-containing protein n=1 Tax=Pustulibacterium marinum TaxID=1224947 RepID=A0A1I7I7T9_9FLAO|nr:DUF4286 family protein [Pustulibacterium marinum]SFU68836.1 protein of unknown function [Pustulibacterium marinum]